MKIAFLNEARTEAVVVRGWFRKRAAIVIRRDERWRYKAHNILVAPWLDKVLDDAMAWRTATDAALPEARALPSRRGP